MNFLFAAAAEWTEKKRAALVTETAQSCFSDGIERPQKRTYPGENECFFFFGCNVDHIASLKQTASLPLKMDALFGEDSHFDSYFSIGLVQPPTS